MKKFDITVALDTGYGYRTIKTLKGFSLAEAFDTIESLTNYNYFGIDVGNNQKEEFVKGLNYAITESKGVK